MATMQEAVNNLNSLERANLKKIIELSKELFSLRKLQFDRLKNYVQKRQDKVTAILKAWEDSQTNSSIATEYTTFQKSLKTLLKKNSNLDEILGVLNRTAYGEAKQLSGRNREKSELTYYTYLLGTIDSNFSEIQTNINSLNALL
jgi:Mg2+ and Co2+ transporter CorA